MSGQWVFNDRLDTLERNAASHDENLSAVLSRMDSFCPEDGSANDRRVFPSHRGARGRGRPHIVLSSDRRSYESKSREFSTSRKRGSDGFRSSARDGPSRLY